jgi:hypothetical protein
MKRQLIKMALGVLLCVLAFCSTWAHADTSLRKHALYNNAGRPVVGAIRWDGWNEWDVWQRAFDPPQWRYRLPFFASVGPDGKARMREDSQEVIDKEIAYAKAGGLDYWAFDWFHPDGWPPNSERMAKCLQLYLSSKHKMDINYCLIILGGPHLGPKEELSTKTLDYLVLRFRDSNYQKVMGNRPLVYFFEIADVVKYMGSIESAREWLRSLRQKTIAAGLGSPYYVVMTFCPPEGAQQVNMLGCDALGSYSAFAPENDNKEYPYATLTERNLKFWRDCKATGKQVVPTVNTGWDYRPAKRPEYPELIQSRNMNADWIHAATPRQIADHLRTGVRWVKLNPDACPANTLLIYAWNELGEGGWLVPTLQEGTARLDAISKVLGAGPCR